jgi:glutamyl-Q tRNA(Asp) synthetase
MSYIGRYAPSPSGPLHFGSLVAAMASYLEARANNGLWLLRIDDLDIPRTMPGATDSIFKTLEALGFEWHGEITYQSRRTEAYINAFEALSQQDLIYPCACTRKEIADSATQGIDSFIYPGTCRQGVSHLKEHYAWRIKSAPINISINDAIQGLITQNIGTDIGDFVLKRADGLFTYQLATVVDDAHQSVTHILRGADLLDSTPRQVYLQKILNIAQPEYAHIPVATNALGEKLSKQTLATSLDIQQTSTLLWQALDFLGQNPPNTLKRETTGQIWQWAKSHWQLDHVPRQRTINITKYLT